jgi:hypothetical protein
MRAVTCVSANFEIARPAAAKLEIACSEASCRARSMIRSLSPINFIVAHRHLLRRKKNEKSASPFSEDYLVFRRSGSNRTIPTVPRARNAEALSLFVQLRFG